MRLLVLYIIFAFLHFGCRSAIERPMPAEFLCDERVTALAISADDGSKVFAVGGSYGTVHVWDTVDDCPLQVWHVGGRVIAIEFLGEDVYICSVANHETNVDVLNIRDSARVSKTYGFVASDMILNEAMATVYLIPFWTEQVVVLDAQTLLETHAVPLFGAVAVKGLGESEGLLFVGGGASVQAMNLDTFESTIVAEVSASSVCALTDGRVVVASGNQLNVYRRSGRAWINDGNFSIDFISGIGGAIELGPGQMTVWSLYGGQIGLLHTDSRHWRLLDYPGEGINATAARGNRFVVSDGMSVFELCWPSEDQELGINGASFSKIKWATESKR